MKIELDKNKLKELIKAYYHNNTIITRALNVDVGVEKWYKKNDTGYRPRVDLLGLFENYGCLEEKEVTLNENKITRIIKSQLEEDGYDVEEVKYNCDEKEFGVVEVMVKEKSNRGEMKVENLELYEKCLIVVDMVNGFVREGVLHDEKIADIIPRQIELIKEAKHEGKLIVFIKDTHNENSVEFERFGNTKHCVEGEAEAELVDELKEFEKDGIAIKKNSTCFMEAPDFRELMELQKELKDFDIVGCCTDICVVNGAIALANYLDQQDRVHKIRVHEDAIATYAEDNRKEYVDAAKILMKQQGIDLVKKGR